MCILQWTADEADRMVELANELTKRHADPNRHTLAEDSLIKDLDDYKLVLDTIDPLEVRRNTHQRPTVPPTYTTH